MGGLTLDAILDLLNAHHQRATYGAVAGVLGKSARSVMQGRPRDWRHSWVVNAETGWPSEYPAGKVHPAIEEREEVVSSPEELLQWIETEGWKQ
jgi:hypothetical protein